jgi:hypothetical protein
MFLSTSLSITHPPPHASTRPAHPAHERRPPPARLHAVAPAGPVGVWRRGQQLRMLPEAAAAATLVAAASAAARAALSAALAADTAVAAVAAPVAADVSVAADVGVRTIH